jgi:hypothetical protein
LLTFAASKNDKQNFFTTIKTFNSMKKANFLFAVVAFATLTFFTSCSSYGPAFSHQRLGYMERPFGEKTQAQVYASGNVGTDATYKASESNVNGGLGVHLGYNTFIFQGAIGVLGVGGRYTDELKKTYGYNSFGLKIHNNFKIPVNENLEVQIIGFGGTFNTAGGSYEDLRKARISRLFASDTILSDAKDLGKYFLTTGVRYRTKNNILLGFQYAYGSTGGILLPINASHCLSFTGNFGNSTVALNLSIPNSGGITIKSAVQPTISIGFTQGLKQGGL